MLLKWRLKMLKYKEELLKQNAPEEAVAEPTPVPVKEPERELTEKEKDALVREELAQLRASALAKKKREKKKVRISVCASVCECVWRIPVVLVTNSRLTCIGPTLRTPVTRRD